MATIAGKKPPDSTMYSAQRRDAILSSTMECSTRHWLDPFARAESKLLLKIRGLSE